MTEYKMRKANRQLTEQDALSVFEEAAYVTVSTVDEDGMPYGVPLSFVCVEDKLYVHMTNDRGHKSDNFGRDGRVCATAVVDVEACWDGDFTTSYGSAMMFGRIHRVTEDVEVRRALVALCMKYLPEYKSEIGAAMEREWANTAVWVIEPDSITGKAAHRGNTK
ncbi:pyridoxamine 5'-phosphate oxidase family protein [Eggerthella sp. YY7918]|uniref:pyridoxamine 5'-phosphate oxidase family protein n=1 Tax=Eggerthella sp. (strain YY7918) TaxID=502558 RepID=UPI0002171064|nr:pyridoxamine 5'-phosphate oxidase family protein [Eggerthella sp. YY7918]BAK43859.1 hypothetical protein EGYY_06580 [Eggerthella sp. YY7918]